MRPSLPSVLMDFTEVLLLDQVNWASNNVLEGDKLTHTWDLGGNRLFLLHIKGVAEVAEFISVCY